MKKWAQLALAGAAVGALSLLGASRSEAAQTDFPKLNHGINTWMVRAMDECSAATVSVLTPGSPSAGCTQANAGTDDMLGMKLTKLQVTTRGRIALFGTGFTVADALRVHLKLRITKKGVVTKHPPGVNDVTFQDVLVDCPQPTDAFLVRPNGGVVGSTDLAACLSPNTGLAQNSVNIEVLDVTLINVANGKIVAVPGILR